MRDKKIVGNIYKSLASKMLLRVFCFCILPVILIVSISGIYIINQTQKQAQQTITQSLKGALDISQNRLESAFNASLQTSYSQIVKNAWQKYQKNGDEILLFEEVNSFLSRQYKYDDKFLNAIIIDLQDTNNVFYATNTTSNGSYTGIKKFKKYFMDDVLQYAQQKDGRVKFLGQENHCFMIRVLMDDNYNPYAALILELNDKSIFESLKSITWANDVTIFIDDIELSILGETLQKPDNLEIQKYKLSGSTYTLSGTGLSAEVPISYAVKGDAQGLKTQIQTTQFVFVAIIFLILPLIGSVVLFFHKQVNLPIKSLMQASHEIKKGEFGTNVDAENMQNQEFKYLADSFNEMSDTLKNQFERIYKEEISLRDAKIMALQSQINPHFLNNTLEIINWESRIGGNIKVCQMIEALSTMLNAAMNRENKHLVRLSEEMMYVDAYLLITRERLGNRLTVIKDIDESITCYYVPKLVLQPIIENAVVHGITPTQKGTITIRAYKTDNWLNLEVENDGVTTYEDLIKIQNILKEGTTQNTNSSSLGIKNVNQRLKILYGEKGGLFINLTEKGNLLSHINVNIEQNGQ